MRQDVKQERSLVWMKKFIGRHATARSLTHTSTPRRTSTTPLAGAAEDPTMIAVACVLSGTRRAHTPRPPIPPPPRAPPRAPPTPPVTVTAGQALRHGARMPKSLLRGARAVLLAASAPRVRPPRACPRGYSSGSGRFAASSAMRAFSLSRKMAFSSSSGMSACSCTSAGSSSKAGGASMQNGAAKRGRP